MDTASATGYLSSLLNRPVAGNTSLRLSSAQRARFLAWLYSRGVQPTDGQLSGAFTVESLLGAPGSSPSAAAMPAAATTAAPDAGPFDIGMDLQSITEIAGGVNLSDLKADEQMARIFTARELSYAQIRPDPAQTIAGLFAAKEAVRKCVGGPAWSPEQFREVEVLPDEHGRPTTAGFSVSITHSAGLAAAVACRIVMPQLASPAQPAPPARTDPAPARHLGRMPLVALLVMIVLQVAILLGRYR